MYVGGSRCGHIELPLLAFFVLLQVQARRIRIAYFEVARSATRVLHAVARLSEAVHFEPLLPARMAMSGGDLRIEVQAIAVFEAHRSFVNRLDARTTCDACPERARQHREGTNDGASLLRTKVESGRGTEH